MKVVGAHTELVTAVKTGVETHGFWRGQRVSGDAQEVSGSGTVLHLILSSSCLGDQFSL